MKQAKIETEKKRIRGSPVPKFQSRSNSKFENDEGTVPALSTKPDYKQEKPVNLQKGLYTHAKCSKLATAFLKVEIDAWW